MQLARDLAVSTTADTPLQPGPVALTTPAGLTAEITAVTREDWGNGVFTSITFRFDGLGDRRFSSLRLLGAGGTPRKGHISSTVHYGDRCEVTYALNDKHPASADLELSLWEDLTVLPLEINVTAPLGAAP